MNISQVARLVGLSVHTLRYYEKIGLVNLSKDERQRNNYRRYDQSTIDLLTTLKNFREMGFSIADIKGLQKSWKQDELNCGELTDVITSKIEELSLQIKMLEKSKITLDQASVGCQDCFDAVRLLSYSNSAIKCVSNSSVK